MKNLELWLTRLRLLHALLQRECRCLADWSSLGVIGCLGIGGCFAFGLAVIATILHGDSRPGTVFLAGGIALSLEVIVLAELFLADGYEERANRYQKQIDEIEGQMHKAEAESRERFQRRLVETYEGSRRSPPLHGNSAETSKAGITSLTCNESGSPSSKNSKLRACPDCEREVSWRATTCPHCGCPLTRSIAEPVMPPSEKSSRTDPRQLWWAVGLAAILAGVFIIGYINRLTHNNEPVTSDTLASFATSDSQHDSITDDVKKKVKMDPMKSFEIAMQPVEKGLYGYHGESFDGQHNELEMSLRLKGRIEFDPIPPVKYDVEKTQFLGSTHVGKISFGMKMKATVEGVVDNRRFRIPFDSNENAEASYEYRNGVWTFKDVLFVRKHWFPRDIDPKEDLFSALFATELSNKRIMVGKSWRLTSTDNQEIIRVLKVSN